MIKPKVLKAKQFIPIEKPWPQGVHPKFDGDGWYVEKCLHPWKPDVNPGDWVIYDDVTRWVCSDDEFKEKYETVEDLEPR
jgi:hypothetical protein